MAETIVCVSTMMWDGLPTRKQRFMSHFASQGYDVLYVEPPLSIMAPIRQPELAEGVGIRSRVREAQPRLWVLNTGLGVPGMGGRLPTVQSLRYRSYYRSIARTCRRLGLVPHVHWTYTAESAAFLGRLGERVTVFDCVDDLAHYPGVNAGRTDELQRQLVASVDLVLTSAQGLGRRWGELNASTRVIPNGFDAGVYYPSNDPDTDHAVVASVRRSLGDRPLATFVGGIYEWIDIELLHSVAMRLPDVGFVLAGPVGTGIDTDALECEPNVVFLGRVGQEEAGALVRASAVCLNPFKGGALTESVNPLKVYEYLGAGRPCVTTPMSELAHLHEVLFVAEDEDAFVAHVRDAVTEPRDSVRVMERVRAVRKYEWKTLCAEAEAALRCVL